MGRGEISLGGGRRGGLRISEAVGGWREEGKRGEGVGGDGGGGGREEEEGRRRGLSGRGEGIGLPSMERWNRPTERL